MHQTYLTKCAHVEPKTERVYAPGWRLRAPVCASSTSPRWSSWRRSPERDSLFYFIFHFGGKRCWLMTEGCYE